MRSSCFRWRDSPTDWLAPPAAGSLSLAEEESQLAQEAFGWLAEAANGWLGAYGSPPLLPTLLRLHPPWPGRRKRASKAREWRVCGAGERLFSRSRCAAVTAPIREWHSALGSNKAGASCLSFFSHLPFHLQSALNHLHRASLQDAPSSSSILLPFTMKSFAVASVLVLVASVAAQTPNLGDLPTCAVSLLPLLRANGTPDDRR